MTEREKILARITEALRVSAPPPGVHGEGGAAHLPEPEGFASWLPDPGSTPEEWITLFGENSEALKTEFLRAASAAELPALVAGLAQREGWKAVASHRDPLAERAVTGLPFPVLLTDGGYDIGALEACDAGITGCDALVAQTGSVLVTTKSAGGRALSVLPHHHVVVATHGQLLPDLPAALRLVEERYGDACPSFVGFITGPSRTGDIERILVLGAHGPKKLTVILCG